MTVWVDWTPTLMVAVSIFWMAIHSAQISLATQAMDRLSELPPELAADVAAGLSRGRRHHGLLRFLGALSLWNIIFWGIAVAIWIGWRLALGSIGLGVLCGIAASMIQGWLIRTVGSGSLTSVHVVLGIFGLPIVSVLLWAWLATSV